MEQEVLKEVQLFTDGAAEPNPGPAGIGYILRMGDKEKEFSQGYIESTNNRMELRAVIAGLEKLTKKVRLTVFSDSKYVVDAVEKGWLLNWQKLGWRRKEGPLKNADLWARLSELLEQHEVEFEWVRGHSGHTENERCDQLAVAAAKSFERIQDEGYLDEIIPESTSEMAYTKSGKLKMEKEGDLCRKCQTPVRKHIPQKKHLQPDQTIYYEYILVCPGCETVYNPEAAMRTVVKGPGLFD